MGCPPRIVHAISKGSRDVEFLVYLPQNQNTCIRADFRSLKINPNRSVEYRNKSTVWAFTRNTNENFSLYSLFCSIISNTWRSF
jgi:hypothetical protein